MKKIFQFLILITAEILFFILLYFIGFWGFIFLNLSDKIISWIILFVTWIGVDTLFTLFFNRYLLKLSKIDFILTRIIFWLFFLVGISLFISNLQFNFFL